MHNDIAFSELEGKILTKIDVAQDKDQIVFVTDTGIRYRMCHEQECCESVTVEDVCGDLKDLLNTPIVQAFEKSEHSDNGGKYIAQSTTYTFYTLATVKGTVTIRWYGTSNGYYSESVSFVKNA